MYMFFSACLARQMRIGSLTCLNYGTEINQLSPSKSGVEGKILLPLLVPVLDSEVHKWRLRWVAEPTVEGPEVYFLAGG